MKSKAVEGTWIRTGSYGWLRVEWVNVSSENPAYSSIKIVEGSLVLMHLLKFAQLVPGCPTFNRYQKG